MTLTMSRTLEGFGLTVVATLIPLLLLLLLLLLVGSSEAHATVVVGFIVAAVVDSSVTVVVEVLVAVPSSMATVVVVATAWTDSSPAMDIEDVFASALGTASAPPLALALAASPVVAVVDWANAFTVASSCLSTSHIAKLSKARVKSNVRSSVHCWRRTRERSKEGG